MIKICDVSIENYRSIIGNPLEYDLGDYNVIIGPNNSGKSNMLRALQLFFNGEVDSNPYNPEIDFPKTRGLPSRAQTRITVTLKYQPQKDTRIEHAIASLEKESGQKRLSGQLLRLRLEYTRQGDPIWKFVSKAGLRSIRADLIHAVVDAVRNSVRFKYLPVGRDIQETIRKELSEELIRTVFSGWSGAVKARQEINEAIKTLLERLQPRLSNSGEEISDAINSVFNEIKKLELRLPFDDLESMLPSLVPSLHDNYNTGLKTKGAGIQTSTLLFLLKYLADHHPQRHYLRITYIWALEEPESYLHPSRQRSMSAVLQRFAKDVQTIITTHSAQFVPRGQETVVIIVDKDESSPYSTTVIGSEYEIARQLLGVSLLDSMYLYPFNIVVEGPADEILLRGVWKKLFSEGRIKTNPNDIRFFPGGNASGACTLYESLITFGNKEEVTTVLMIDGDDVGKKALRGLQKRMQNRVQLKANEDYHVLEKTTEWLTSARVMVKLREERPSQVTVTLNVKKEIIDFVVHDKHKKKVAERIIKLSEISDLKDFEDVILQMESNWLS